MRKISQSDREVQINNVLRYTQFTFVNWPDGFENNKSRVTINCPTHGDWSTSFNNVIAGRRCAKCSTDSRVMSIEEVTIKITENLKQGQTLIGAVEKYKSNQSKFKVMCSIHGEWMASALHLIHSGSGCRQCAFENNAKRNRTPEHIIVSKLNNYQFKSGWSFAGFVDEYKNSRSKVYMNCVNHGQWETDINTVLTNKSGCSSCAKNGYDQKIPATLYILRSTCGLYFKAGISNNVERRITELRRTTPFDFEPIAKINHGGDIILRLERAFHSSFESAQMKGFEGCTEWFKWDHRVVEWVRLL